MRYSFWLLINLKEIVGVATVKMSKGCSIINEPEIPWLQKRQRWNHPKFQTVTAVASNTGLRLWKILQNLLCLFPLKRMARFTGTHVLLFGLANSSFTLNNETRLIRWSCNQLLSVEHDLSIMHFCLMARDSVFSLLSTSKSHLFDRQISPLPFTSKTEMIWLDLMLPMLLYHN